MTPSVSSDAVRRQLRCSCDGSCWTGGVGNWSCPPILVVMRPVNLDVSGGALASQGVGPEGCRLQARGGRDYDLAGWDQRKQKGGCRNKWKRWKDKNPRVVAAEKRGHSGGRHGTGSRRMVAFVGEHGDAVTTTILHETVTTCSRESCLEGPDCSERESFGRARFASGGVFALREERDGRDRRRPGAGVWGEDSMDGRWEQVSSAVRGCHIVL